MSAWSDLVAKLSPGVWYRLGDASGQPQDSSGNAHHSTYETMDTYNQAGALADDTDGSIYFDGSSDLFATTNHDDFEPEYNEDFTIFCWVKFSTSTAGKLLVDFLNAAANKASYRIYTQADGTLRLNRTDGTHAPVVNTPYAVNNNVWQFVAFRKSGSVLNAIANTTWSSNVTDTTTSTVKHADPLCVGAKAAGGSYFPGYLDEFVVVKSALSAEQLRLLYYFGKAGWRVSRVRRTASPSQLCWQRVIQ